MPPQGLLFLINRHFWKFQTCPFWKKCAFPYIWAFSRWAKIDFSKSFDDSSFRVIAISMSTSSTGLQIHIRCSNVSAYASYQSEGFPNGMFGPCAWCPRGLTRWAELLGRRRRRRRRHLKTQVNIQARKLYLKVFLWFWDRGERYLRMETGVLHRISMRVSWA